jgi:transcriptional regulator with XRE-family HTH domain
MARAALNWSTRDLAKAAGVSSNTVSRFESGKPAIPATLKTIRQAFEAAGVRFESGGVFPPESAAEAEERHAVEESAASMMAREE